MLKMATEQMKTVMSELNTLKQEIKNRRTDLKKLTDRVKDLNKIVADFLKNNNQPGIKDSSQGIAIISKKVKRVVRKKKKEEINYALKSFCTVMRCIVLYCNVLFCFGHKVPKSIRNAEADLVESLRFRTLNRLLASGDLISIQQRAH